MNHLPDPETLQKNLKKREQELECLYRVTAETHSDHDLRTMLLNIAEYLRQGLQFPDNSFPAVELDGVRYSVERDVPRDEVLTQFGSDIVTCNRKRGTVSVWCGNGAAFLREEEELIREVAGLVSKAVERREMEAELKQYAGKLEELDTKVWRRRHEEMFMRAPTPLLITGLNADVMRANPAFYRLLDYPTDGSVELNLVRDRLYENAEEVRAIIYQKLLEDGVVNGLEVNLIGRDGNPVPVLASCAFIDLDGERCIESDYKDIRVRKALEEELIEQNENLERKVRDRTADLQSQKDLLVRKNQELLAMTKKLEEHRSRLQALFEAITDTVIVVDGDLNLTMTNQKEMGNRGKCFRKVFSQKEPCQDCLARKVFAEKKPASQEKVVDDEYYLIRAYPIFDANCRVNAVLESSRRITKEKSMERQLLQADKLASLGQLVSGIGHEINNPNTFIRGNLFIVQEAMQDIFPILDKHHRTHPELRIARLNYDIFRQNVPILINDMVEGANRIKGIVEGLRKFGKRDDGFLNEMVDVNRVAESCLRLVDNQIRRNALVTVNLAADLPKIMGNAQKLQQVILNILINASQAMDKPRGKIRVSTFLEGKEVAIRLKDNGKGMNEKTIGQIFDPFFTTKRHQGGTGLGLSIAYGIVKEHKGRIEVVSEVGVAPPSASIFPWQARRNDEQILVIDDDQAVLNYLNIFLLQAGTFDVTTLANSARAYGELQNNAYDLLLLDMDMPEVTGLDILKTIQETTSI
jgi:PAS domain S-box-containing protein